MEGTKGQHVQVEKIITVIAHQLSSLAQAARQVLARSATSIINSFELGWVDKYRGRRRRQKLHHKYLPYERQIPTIVCSCNQPSMSTSSALSITTSCSSPSSSASSTSTLLFSGKSVTSKRLFSRNGFFLRSLLLTTAAAGMIPFGLR
jgi:hypothetical protein